MVMLTTILEILTATGKIGEHLKSIIIIIITIRDLVTETTILTADMETIIVTWIITIKDMEIITVTGIILITKIILMKIEIILAEITIIVTTNDKITNT